MPWTAEQQAAIDSPKATGLSGQTLLVAAAAGSGKTTVLVERIIRRLSELDEHLQPTLTVQNLMVVTFTKAAAAQMSAKIGLKLSEAFTKANERREMALAAGDKKELAYAAALCNHLEHQLNLLPSAHISTLHSFCQWVIRSYFYKLDMDPSFRIGNEGEIGLIKMEVLDTLFLEAYQNNDYHILELADMFSDNRSDAALQEQVMQLYNFAIALDNPERWLDDIKKLYTKAQNQGIKETFWGEQAWLDQLDYVAQLESLLTEMQSTFAQVPLPYDDYKSWAERWQLIISGNEAIVKSLKAATKGHWGEMNATVTALAAGEIINLPGGNAKTYSLEIKAKLNAAYNQFRNIVKAMPGGPFILTESQIKKQLAAQYPYIVGLVDLTLAFIERFRKAKQAEGMIDFSDLEHLCLRLLTEAFDEEGKRIPSEAAKEIRDSFKEVMVDEYQDTNGVQEAIINLVSKKDNRFYVGDIKQSIYRFRMADPDLFREKYETYAAGEAGKSAIERRIDLANNFRSHHNIMTFTNFLFSQIMTREGAELDYGEAECLDPGRTIVPEGEEPPEDWVGGPVEIHLVDVLTESTEEEDSPEDLKNEEKEWQLIIRKILELKDSKKTVQEEGEFRPIKWKDIAILMRSISGRANRLVDALQRAGIPAYAEENGGYFSAMEVQLVLSLLQVIDNPEQDLPMAAVLSSYIVGMDAVDLGRLRLSGEGSLWSLLADFARKEQNPDLEKFVERFERWRTLSRRHGVSELIWQIYEETNLLDYMSALPNGMVRRANLTALYERAKQYEAGNFRGLFRFLRFIESLQKAGEDLALAKVSSEADDVVRIMSIHKSKGLEFPVVFLAGTQKKFNTKDLSNAMLLHKTSGLGLKAYNSEYRILYHSIPWLYQRQRLEEALKAEEERILYVALTRAKDKLFITGFVKNIAKTVKEKYAKALQESELSFSKDLILSCHSYLDWILYAEMRHLGSRAPLVSVLEGATDSPFDMTIFDKKMSQKGKKLWACHISLQIHDGTEFSEMLEFKASSDATDLLEQVRDLKVIEGNPLSAELIERLTFTYEHQGAVETAAKISVSEIKRRFTEQEEEAEILMPMSGQAFKAKPLNLVTPKTVTGARRGTLMHEAMQWLPNEEYNLESLQMALDGLVDKGYILEEERTLLDEEGLLSFFESDLGRRMREAKLQGNQVEHELPFSMLFEAQRVYPNIGKGEKVFLQGIIDTAFVEDDQWILIDYKTDRVKSEEELLHRYRIQLDLYKEALNKLTGKVVKNTYIYSFRLRKAIEL